MYINNSKGAKSEIFILLTKIFSVKLENNFHILTCFEHDGARYDVNRDRTLQTRQIGSGNFELKRPQKHEPKMVEKFRFHD